MPVSTRKRGGFNSRQVSGQESGLDENVYGAGARQHADLKGESVPCRPTFRAPRSDRFTFSPSGDGISIATLVKPAMEANRVLAASTNVGALTVAELDLRELHLIKKALAIAVLAIERMPSEFQSSSDQTDMKGLLDRLISSDIELARYARAARIAVTGDPD